MEPVKSHGEFGIALCKALGLDSEGIYKIDIIVNAEDTVMIKVSTRLLSDKVPGLLHFLNRYELVLKETIEEE